MGSPDFAVPSLGALTAAGHEVVAVYCQPARPSGRGQAVARCAVQVAAEALGIEVRSPARVRRDAAEHERFAALRLDAAVVAAYGLILPAAMLRAPAWGCVNVHASLLPRWRGASPIQSALLAGDAEAGVTIMRMEEGLDTGPMLLREAVTVGPRVTGAGLHDVLAELGARLVVRALAERPDGVVQPEGATYAPKLSRADGRLDWAGEAAALERRVRAFDPWPGTWTVLAGEALKVLAAEVVTGEASGATSGAVPGTVLDGRLSVQCGSEALRLLRVQRPGRAAMDADAFLRGTAVGRGVVLGGEVGAGRGR